MWTHLTDESIEALALGRLNPDSIAHVLICEQCCKKFEETAAVIDALRRAAGPYNADEWKKAPKEGAFLSELSCQNKRREMRRPCSESVTIQWIGAAGTSHMAPGSLGNVSRSGACLVSAHALPANTEILIDHKNGGLPGLIKHASVRQGSYVLGVEFTYGCEWLPEIFERRSLKEEKALASVLEGHLLKEQHIHSYGKLVTAMPLLQGAF